MTAKTYFTNITKYFHQYADLVATLNSFGLTDEAVSAENLFIEILNVIFGWQLKNENENQLNQKAFDLIDRENYIYVQVTTNKSHNAKYKNAIKSFNIPTNRNVEIKFIVIFVSKSISESLLSERKEGNVSYEAYDIEKLLKAVYYKLITPVKLKKLNLLLQSVIEPVLLKESTNSKLLLQNQKEVPIGIGLYIKRENLTCDLLKYCQEKNGLLIGGPGFGKSFVINELQRICHLQKIPCFVIRINELKEGTDIEISDKLKSSLDWLEALKRVKKAKNVKGILIFDAYDTAKDEKLNDTIYKQIRKSIESLAENWNILVSARTYDAAKSSLLQDIFPHGTFNNVVSCRNFEIPELKDQELSTVLEQNLVLKYTIENSSKELQNLIKTPYFLKLVEQIVSDSESENLSSIQTEAQLLEVFWRKKIEDSKDKGLFVQKLTKQLVANTNLMVQRDDIVSEFNVGIFDTLLSLNIIEESTSGGNIGFNHNILLDFAISKYILTNELDYQIKFLAENQKMPFIFRQSFIYFYSQLFKNNKDIFWKHYDEIRKIDKPVFRLFHQTILNYILLNFYNSPEKILPNLTNDDPDTYFTTIRKALESIRYITKGDLRPQDVDLLLVLSSQMHHSLVWEIGNLIDKGITAYKNEIKPRFIKKLAIASCNYLEFILKEKDSKEGELIIRNGRFWGVGNLCQTFPYNKTNAKALIKRILLLLREPGYEIYIFQTLASNLNPIITADSPFGMMIYKTLYFHTEKSDDVTNWGGGVVPLRSTRKQDFGHIYWELEQKYSEYLKIDFSVVMCMGIEIVNKHSKDRRLSYHQEIFKIKIGKVLAFIAFDDDHFEIDEEHGEYSHIKKIFDHFERRELNSSSIKEINADLYLLVSKIEAGKLWRWLLNYLVKHTREFKKLSYEILSNLAVYENNDTLHEAGQLLKSLWSHLNSNEKMKIEQLIHSLKSSTVVHPELVDRRISRLLNCIPDKEFQLPESQVFVSENEKVENALIVEKNSSIMAEAKYLSTEEKISYAGFDLKITEDIDVFAKYSLIEKFNSKFENSENKPRLRTEYKKIIKSAIHIFGMVKVNGFRNAEISKSCDSELSRFARIISDLGKKLLVKEQQLIFSIAMYYINNPKYIPLEYEKGKMNDRMGGVSGPYARSGCINTLQNLLYKLDNKAAGDALFNCIRDNSSYLRYKALYTLNFFWKYEREKYFALLYERLRNENEGACFGVLLNSIHHEDIIKEDLQNVKQSCFIAVSRLREVDDESTRDNWRFIVSTILKIILRHDKKWAFDFIIQNIDIKEFSRNLIFEIRSALNTFKPEDNYLNLLEKGDVFFDVMHAILQYRFKRIQENSHGSSLEEHFEIIDHFIQNLYFAFDYEVGNNKGRRLTNIERNAFYLKIKPILEYVAIESCKIENGFMILHTGYYFMMLLNNLLPIDPPNVLKISNTMVIAAANNGFTYDRSTLTEVVKFTERIIVDYKSILNDKENFNNLIFLLDQFASSGADEAIDLIWRLRDAF